MQLISDHTEGQLLQSLKGKKFSLLADESTDSANRSQFSIMCRLESGHEVKDHFMGIVNVETATSLNLMDAIS